MGTNERINSLKQKHADIETAINSETKNVNPSEETLNNLKRQKLAIKDEIEKLSRA